MNDADRQARIAAQRERGIVAAVDQINRLQQDLSRARLTLRQIGRDLAAHLKRDTDPCEGREPWPCHIARALEPEPGMLEFLDTERKHLR